MKFFDIIPELVMTELLKRGVMTDELLYCVKADMDGEGGYYDTYITFTKHSLYIISGIEEYGRVNRKTRKSELKSYEVTDFNEIELSKIKRLYVDRYQCTARLMVGAENTDAATESSDHGENLNGDYPIARFSIGYSDKFEKFCERVNLTINNEPIDDTLLNSTKTHCPICHEPYPDPNRPVCPRCVDRRSVFKRLMGLFGEFKWSMFLILLTIVLSSVFAIISPIFGSKMLYDDVLAEGGKYYGKVLMIVLLMAGVDFCGLILRVVSGLITSRVVPKVTHTLRTNVFTSLQKLSLQFFTNKQTGSLMSRVDRDTDNVYYFFTDIVPYGLTNFVKVIGITAIMFMLSPVLSVGLILILVVIMAINEKFYKSQRKLYRKYDVAMRSANAVVSDTMNGQRVVKSFAKEQKEVYRYKLKNTDAYSIDMRISNRRANTIPFIWAFCSVVTRVLFCVGAYMVIKGEILFGALTALSSYTNMIYDPINFFMWIGDRWARCMDAASRMFEITDSVPTVTESENPVHIENMQGNIELKNVTFEYEAGHPIINDVSFKVEAGQMFGIVGKTGAGKSTIINLIARLYDVTGGEITIDGVTVKNIKTEDLRRNIGIVSQETYLFRGSIADNIRYARPEATMEEAIQAAKSANAHEFITKLPDSYNTMIGEGGISLSGGERQRISIARAIIQSPNILILDEATASMDTRTERKIQAAIDSLKKGRTIISIAHRLSTLRDADMLCVIENGEMKEIGTHDDLIRRKGKYFDLYKLQSDSLKFITMGD